jgi:hypothetical protein
MLIRTVGLYWHRADVYWRTAFKNGVLSGRAPGGQSVNFAAQIAIYILYADYQIVYVGQTGARNPRLFARLKGHTRDDLADRWNRFSWFGLRRVLANGDLAMIAAKARPTIPEALNHLEAALIHATEPPLNRQGGRFGPNVTRYLQVRDDRLGPDHNTMIKELWERAQSLAEKR